MKLFCKGGPRRGRGGKEGEETRHRESDLSWEKVVQCLSPAALLTTGSIITEKRRYSSGTLQACLLWLDEYSKMSEKVKKEK